MRNFSVVFILAVFALGINGKCREGVILINRPACGIAADCYLHGFNGDVVRNEDCKRKEKGLPPVLEIKGGECPTDKPPCKYIRD
ncbi:accessory gland protein Acp63F-like [Drosophila ficusphila]|uniref:accessory gland protein Acp63F-like n=1 Tax=Drosophila ficusphila TaxID=30025 RepID=UPI0007E8887A|nr:accessory gland protein Acp63F-like [Drosophila ficusphila]